jgi:hypothetical protein
MRAPASHASAGNRFSERHSVTQALGEAFDKVSGTHGHTHRDGLQALRPLLLVPPALRALLRVEYV